MAPVRPYIKLGIADLESIFEAAGADAAILRALVDELRHRNTDRSTALLARIQALLSEAEIKARRGSSGVDQDQRHPEGRAGEAAEPRFTDFPNGSEDGVVEPVKLRTAAPSAATNKPSAILSAWIALEALSPQTYRRPADLVNGDNRGVHRGQRTAVVWARTVPPKLPVVLPNYSGMRSYGPCIR